MRCKSIAHTEFFKVNRYLSENWYKVKLIFELLHFVDFFLFQHLTQWGQENNSEAYDTGFLDVSLPLTVDYKWYLNLLILQPIVHFPFSYHDPISDLTRTHSAISNPDSAPAWVKQGSSILTFLVPKASVQTLLIVNGLQITAESR